MERIKQALEKARQERQTRQGDSTPAGSPAPPPAGSPAPPPTGPAARGTTPVVQVNHALLREHRIITGVETGSFTDAYNLLRTQILQRFKQNDWSVLAVTSPGPSEGKTLTAINLAISIAREVNHSAVLVDANLRHPWLLEQFGLPHRSGLSEYLTGDVPLVDLMLRIEGISDLVIVPGGKPLTSSTEMLNSPRMVQLVAEMKARYRERIIIFDLPPVLGAADTVAFVPHVDATVLVIEEGATQKQDLADAVELLRNTPIVGTVLNKAANRVKS